ASIVFGAANAFAQTPPPQPLSGPGGAQARYSVQRDDYGTGSTEFWIYSPQPLPAPAPVIVFMHGNTAIVPLPYEAWIEHMVQRGNIVIYPRYQTGFSEIFLYYESDALFAIKS